MPEGKEVFMTSKLISTAALAVLFAGCTPQTTPPATTTPAAQPATTTPATTTPATTTPATATPAAPATTTPAMAPAAGVLPYADFASSLQTATKQGGGFYKFEYSEKPGEVKVNSLNVVDNTLVMKYSMSIKKGSTWGAAVLVVLGKPDSKISDVTGYKSLKIQLASSNGQPLMIRLGGSSEATTNTGCYPQLTIKTTKTLQEYTLDLAKFAPFGYCGTEKKTVAQTLPDLRQIDIGDLEMDEAPDRGLTVGSISFVK
jgi:hypothetical protein